MLFFSRLKLSVWFPNQISSHLCTPRNFITILWLKFKVVTSARDRADHRRNTGMGIEHDTPNHPTTRDARTSRVAVQ